MGRRKDKERERGGLLKRMFGAVRRMVHGRVNVYFISGMCYNCKVFDKLRLPEGYAKKYLEWHIPRPDETLQEYARKMAENIDTSRPFVLVGYSFGAVIMQEMLGFLSPRKSIIISSFKSPGEIPAIFKTVSKTRLIRKVPGKFFSSTDFITGAFNHLVYHMPSRKVKKYMTCTDPVYIRWAVERITEWVPGEGYAHLYHIHGTEDQIFPFKQINNVFPVKGGDHLMVVKKAKQVSAILSVILLMK